MPVILNSEIYEPWLDSQNQDLDELKNILKREIITELISHPVSKQVNSASNNNPACIEPIDYPTTSLDWDR
jgi:putative SOS response-associated peptidase YedK